MKEQMWKHSGKIGIVVKGLLMAYLVTGILLVAFAFLVYQTDMEQKKVEAGILFIYIITSFLGGWFAGKIGKNKKYIWGMITGIAYVMILLGVSFLMNGKLSGEVKDVWITLLMCMGSGMLGGMISK